MILLLALAVLIAGVAGAKLVVPSVRRWRMAAELRGDWWSRFERQMRAYERDWRLTTRER